MTIKEEIQRLKLSYYYFNHYFATLQEIEAEREKRVDIFIKKNVCREK